MDIHVRNNGAYSMQVYSLMVQTARVMKMGNVLQMPQ